jgi:hypothetical protein
MLAIYFGIIGTLVAGAGLGLTKIIDASTGMVRHSQREKSLLDERIATARSIKQALAKPVPRPEPLAPITAKPEHAASKAAAASKPARPTLSAEARDAMASTDFSAQSRTQPAVDYDRHAVVSQ